MTNPLAALAKSCPRPQGSRRTLRPTSCTFNLHSPSLITLTIDIAVTAMSVPPYESKTQKKRRQDREKLPVLMSPIGKSHISCHPIHHGDGGGVVRDRQWCYQPLDATDLVSLPVNANLFGSEEWRPSRTSDFHPSKHQAQYWSTWEGSLYRFTFVYIQVRSPSDCS